MAGAILNDARLWRLSNRGQTPFSAATWQFNPKSINNFSSILNTQIIFLLFLIRQKVQFPSPSNVPNKSIPLLISITATYTCDTYFGQGMRQSTNKIIICICLNELVSLKIFLEAFFVVFLGILSMLKYRFHIFTALESWLPFWREPP